MAGVTPDGNSEQGKTFIIAVSIRAVRETGIVPFVILPGFEFMSEDKEF